MRPYVISSLRGISLILALGLGLIYNSEVHDPNQHPSPDQGSKSLGGATLMSSRNLGSVDLESGSGATEDLGSGATEDLESGEPEDLGSGATEDLESGEPEDLKLAEDPESLASPPPTTLPELARSALETWFATGEILDIAVPTEWSRSAGVFVTLSRQGQPRGCWGSLTSTAPNLAEATIRAAIGAATRDWRYPPLKRSELAEISIQVAVVEAVIPLQSLSELDPTRSGLWIRSGSEGAVLLPGEALTTEWQLSQAKQLAGIPAQSPVDLFRVEAQLWHEF